LEGIGRVGSWEEDRRETSKVEKGEVAKPHRISVT
jgi:hypothetical protein